MKILEKFASFNEFNEHFRSTFKDMLPMDPYFYYMLFHSKLFEPLDVMDVLRDHYRWPSDEGRDTIAELCRRAHLASISQHHGQQITKTDEELDYSLAMMMQNDEPSSTPYPAYVFPWPRAKFIQKFYSNVFPSVARDCTNALTASGHIVFKKSFTIVTDMPFTDQLQQQVINDSLGQVADIDFSRIIHDLLDNMQYYRQQYISAQSTITDLQRTIDQMSEQVQAQSLARWY